MRAHPISSASSVYRGLLGLAFVAMPALLAAQQNGPDVAAQLAADRALLASETYVKPPAVIERLVTAPRYLNVSLSQPSPDRTHYLKVESEGLPTVQEYGRTHLYFAGLQVDPVANRNRSLTTRGASGLQLIDAATGKSSAIETPAGATVSSATWSPKGQQIAYLANFSDGSHIYVADVATGKSRRVTRTPVLATLVTSIDWTADGKSVIAVLIPDNRMAKPERPAIATGPEVRLWTDSLRSPQRNFWSLLEDPFDKALMEYFTTGQLVLIDVQSRAIRKIGSPAMISRVDASPDGQVFRVTTMKKPFSYVVQYNSFGQVEELWDGNGTVLSEISDRPLREAQDTSDGGGFNRGTDDGAKRGLSWMPNGQGMYYLEPVPGRNRDSAETNPAPRGARGGAGNGAGGSRADRLVQWRAPYGPVDTTVLYTGDGPISDVLFSDDAQTIFVASTRSGTGELFAVRLDEPGKKISIVRQRGYTPGFDGGGGRGFFGRRGGSADDSLSFYNNPGQMMTKRGSLGGRVAMVSSDGAVYLTATQYHRDWQTDAPQEFVDKVVLATGVKTRVLQSPADVYETVSSPLDDDFTRVIVTRQSPAMVPNAFLRDLRTGTLTPLTENTDVAPEFTSAMRKRVWVTRVDGIKFLVNLTLPADYRPGTKLPAMLWLYPYEYTDQGGYDRTLRTQNINAFPNSGTRTIEYLTTQGYAVANFQPPIIGETGRMNDNYVPDLRMNLTAVIDELDRQGYIDRTRLAIGGHSYGAFSTANAMVHTPYFKAGIAGDGMYNRTLTPNGFQSERRDLWNGQRTYIDMSPMLYADRLQGALLMYHSMEDQNVGTNLDSSIRMMQALRAQGKTAALFMYPYEDHGPATRETLLDQWARWTAWLDIYVKHAGVSATPAVAAELTPSSTP